MSSTTGMVGHAHVWLSRLLMRAAYGTVALSIGVFVIAAWRELTPLFTGAGIGLVMALLLTVASYAVWFMRGMRPGGVAVDGDDVVIRRGAGARTLSRASIQSAALVERPLAGTLLPYVEIDLRNGDRFTVAVPEGEEVARALVAELGFGPSGHRVRLDLAAPARRLFHPLIGFAAYQVPNVIFSIVASILEIYWLQILSVPLMIVLYIVARRLVRAPVVTVGDDGLLWEAGWKKRYVALRDIVGLEQVHPTAPLTILTRDAGNIALAGAAIDLQRTAAVGRALRERLARALPAAVGAEQRSNGADRAVYFARGGRTVADWRAALANILEASYRASSASVEDIAAVLTSPAATPEERVGAALALRVAGEPPQRIRIAAESVASEPLREALEAAAEGDDATVDAMLRRMSA